MTERETLLAEIAERQNIIAHCVAKAERHNDEIAERQARLAELDAEPDYEALINDICYAAACMDTHADKFPVPSTAFRIAAKCREGAKIIAAFAKAPPMGSVMTDAEIEELTKGELPYTAARIKWAVKRTLSRVQPRWPSEAELEQMVTESSQKRYSPYAAALEMANRIRAYQKGE
jgi:hypothetical protein